MTAALFSLVVLSYVRQLCCNVILNSQLSARTVHAVSFGVLGVQFERRMAKSESELNVTPHLSRDVKVRHLIKFCYL